MLNLLASRSRTKNLRVGDSAGRQKTRRRRLLLESLEDRRLLTAGMLDLSFGTHGKVITDMNYPHPVGSTATAVETVIIAGVPKIVVAGYGADLAYYIARYNDDGSLDSSFGNAGRQAVDFNGLVEDVAVAADGTVVVVGYDSTTNAEGYVINTFAIARLTPSGQLDSSFDGDGKQTINFGNRDDRANSVLIQADGSLLVAGIFSSDEIGGRYAVAKLTPSGQLDTSFGNGGQQLIGFGSATNNQARGIAVQSDGKIVVSGTTDQGGATGYDVAVARLTTAGQLDLSFGVEGKAVLSRPVRRIL